MNISSSEGLLSAKHLKKSELISFFKTCLKPQVKSENKQVEGLGVLAFFEASTRTEMSFEAAGLELGIKWIRLEADQLSLQKGETLRDTFEVVKAAKPQFVVARHKESYLPHWIHEWTGLKVLNAGDGQNEHPTQALLDGLTIFEKFGGRSLKIGFFGDLIRSRVARSLIHVLRELGHDLYALSDGTDECELFLKAFRLKSLSRAAFKKMNLVYALRTQSERGSAAVLKPFHPLELSEKASLMHPGPVIWGRDLAFEFKADERSLILQQVKNGFLVRRELMREILWDGAIPTQPPLPKGRSRRGS